MTYLDRLLVRARKADMAPPVVREGRLRADAGGERWRAPDSDGADRQAALYANLAWIQIAVSAVASVVATTPYRVMQLAAGREPRALAGHDFEMLLRKPNPMQSRYEFLEATYAWRRVTGDCYWWLNRPTPDAPPEEVWIIPSGQVVPVPDGQMGVAYYRYDPGDGRPLPIPPEEIVHFKTWNPIARYTGLSAVQALALDAHSDIAAQRYNLSFYDRDNAKPGGILAFADNIDDGPWRRLDEDLKDQTGGTKNRRIMKLRNVGAGGVQWITLQMSRSDMQYLEQRTFTKEEIFSLLAPGLASILAVNATEANSTAGKDTFLSMAVHPALVAIGEKIASDVLPAYGDDLAGEFADVRRADTEMELKAREAYERTHTVDEVRARYDGDPPLGDERGRMLVAAAQGAQPAPAEPDLAAMAKAYERKQWRTKALKAQAQGRSADVPFTPEHLGDDEAMQIRAALRRGDVAGAFGEAQ